MKKKKENLTFASANMEACMGGLSLFAFGLIVRTASADSTPTAASLMLGMNVAAIGLILLYAFVQRDVRKILTGAVLLGLALVILCHTGTTWLFGYDVFGGWKWIYTYIPAGFVGMVLLDCLKKALYLVYAYFFYSEDEFEYAQDRLSEAYVCTVAMIVAIVCRLAFL
jgi:drug/metabolite transporter (DMT)-like permease